MLKSIAVKDYMTKNLITLSPDMEILQAARTLVENKISGAPVIDEHGNLVGMVTEKDCLRVAFHASYHEEWGGRVSEFMSRQVKTIEADTSIADLTKQVVTDPHRGYPVVEDNRLVGQISRHDVLKALETLW